jgi:ABC-type glycerol-3-phosphate transport system permease component
MAGATIMTVPVLVGYFLTQRHAWMEGRLAGLAR